LCHDYSEKLPETRGGPIRSRTVDDFRIVVIYVLGRQKVKIGLGGNLVDMWLTGHVCTTDCASLSMHNEYACMTTIRMLTAFQKLNICELGGKAIQ